MNAKPGMRALLFPVLAMMAVPLMAQTSTDFTATITLPEDARDEVDNAQQQLRAFAGVAAVGNLGNAALVLRLAQRLSDNDYVTGEGPVTVNLLTIMFNRTDQVSVVSAGQFDPGAATATVPARVSGGTGAYQNATSAAGAMRFTLTRTSTSPLKYNLSLLGTATMNGQPLNLTITGAPLAQGALVNRVFDMQPGTAVITPFGNATVNVVSRPDTDRWGKGDSVHFIEVNVTFTFSPTETLQSFFRLIAVNGNPQFETGLITGGTGRFAGASGIFRVLSDTENDGTETVMASGTVIQPGPSAPIIASVNTAGGFARFPAGAVPGISQNAWIEIKGSRLVPATTPAGGVFWSNAPEFAQGKMPTQLGEVSVTVNGKPAYVWWYCSAATTTSCATDQINVLAPLDDYLGQVPVVVKNGTQTSAALMVFKQADTASFLLFSARGDGVATHADGSLLGPTTLYPGASTPGKRGETVSLWGVGFGLPTATLVQGSATQSGTFPVTPSCFLNGASVQAAAALVSPGLYQFNVTIPQDATAGNGLLYCTLRDSMTALIVVAVQ